MFKEVVLEKSLQASNVCSNSKKRSSRQVSVVGTLLCTVGWFVRGVTHADDGQQL
jgi:hypothetical protein